MCGPTSFTATAQSYMCRRSGRAGLNGVKLMRSKVNEVPCRDDTGHTATVIEWEIRSPGSRCQSSSRDFTLADGSPVTPLGGKYEHFYSGKIYTPVGAKR